MKGGVPPALTDTSGVFVAKRCLPLRLSSFMCGGYVEEQN
jgi:hypothetical protein